jgi:hypothetical protein
MLTQGPYGDNFEHELAASDIFEGVEPDEDYDDFTDEDNARSYKKAETDDLGWLLDAKDRSDDEVKIVEGPTEDNDSVISISIVYFD